MPNLSSLTAAATTATTLGGLVLAIPQLAGGSGARGTIGYQPQAPSDPSANGDGTATAPQLPPNFVFHYEGDQSIEVEADITDHYLEDNTAVQNNIALKPVTINTKGFIGELNDIVPPAFKIATQIRDKLTAIAGYAPGLTTTANLLYNNAFMAYQSASILQNAAVSAWSSISGDAGTNVINADGIEGVDIDAGEVSGNQDKQQTAFQLFYGYYVARRLFTVQTPWAVFQDMAIASIRPTQSGATRTVSEFSLRFKQIRTAKTTLSLDSITATYQTRARSQASPAQNLGSQAGGSTEVSLSGELTSHGMA